MNSESTYFINYVRTKSIDTSYLTSKDSAYVAEQNGEGRNCLKEKVIVKQKMVKSLFIDHYGKFEKFKIINRNINESDWITGVFIFVLFLLAYIQTNHKRRFLQIIKALSGTRYFNILIREGNVSKELITYLLNGIYLTIISLVIYIVLQKYNVKIFNKSGFSLYLIILFYVSAFYLLKSGLVFFIGNLFNIRKAISEYLIQNNIYYQVTALVFIPVLLFFLYSHKIYFSAFLTFSIIFFCLGLMFRLFKMFFWGINTLRFSALYIFLYLCTIEILPVLCIGKFLLSYIS